MKKQIFSALAMVMVMAMTALTGCAPKPTEVAETEPAASVQPTVAPAAADAPKPGDSGFDEIPIGETVSGPFSIATVYFQGVDMIPENKQPTAAESDMHLEADIKLLPEAAAAFGFGNGDDIWPAYLTVNYKVMSTDGKTEITSGTMMPMNADDGAHYGINVKKGLIPVGAYKLILEVKASDDYLLHVDGSTGVPTARDNGVESAAKYYEKQTVEFDWNYDGRQLVNK